MSCICQYFAPGVDSGVDQVEAFPLAPDGESPAANAKEEADKETPETTVSASDLADCRAENWLLKKKLTDYEVTIENLEQLVNIIVDKQHRILSEMFQLSKENRELQTECDLQREYHSMERNALMKQLHEVQTLSRNRSLELGRAALEENTKGGSEGHVEAAKATCLREESSGTEEECSTGEEEEDTDDERESDFEYDSYEDDEDYEDYEASAPNSRSSSPFSSGSESGDTDSEADRSLASDSERESDTD